MEEEGWRSWPTFSAKTGRLVTVPSSEEDATVVSDITLDTDNISQSSLAVESTLPERRLFTWDGVSQPSDGGAPDYVPCSQPTSDAELESTFDYLSSLMETVDTSPTKPERKGSTHNRSKNKQNVRVGGRRNRRSSRSSRMSPISEEDKHGAFQCDSPVHAGRTVRHIPANPQDHSSKTSQMTVVVQGEEIMKDYLGMLTEYLRSPASPNNSTTAIRQVESSGYPSSKSEETIGRTVKTIDKPTAQMMETLERLSILQALSLSPRSNKQIKKTEEVRRRSLQIFSSLVPNTHRTPRRKTIGSCQSPRYVPAKVESSVSRSPSLFPNLHDHNTNKERTIKKCVEPTAEMIELDELLTPRVQETRISAPNTLSTPRRKRRESIQTVRLVPGRVKSPLSSSSESSADRHDGNPKVETMKKFDKPMAELIELLERSTPRVKNPLPFDKPVTPVKVTPEMKALIEGLSVKSALSKLNEALAISLQI